MPSIKNIQTRVRSTLAPDASGAHRPARAQVQPNELVEAALRIKLRGHQLRALEDEYSTRVQPKAEAAPQQHGDDEQDSEVDVEVGDDE